MKLRYQMRGLAVGIIVTALLMGIATDEGRPLTDAEIRAAAAELGMVESDSLKLTDIQSQTSKPTAEPTTAPTSEPVAEPTVAPTGEPTAEPTTAPTSEPVAEPTVAPTSEPVAEPTTAPTSEPAAEPAVAPTSEPATEPTEKPAAQTVLITVKPGDTSISVSKLLAEAGVVANAGTYDQYLCDNGYSRRIAVGSFEIPVDASEEEIAKIITRSK